MFVYWACSCGHMEDMRTFPVYSTCTDLSGYSHSGSPQCHQGGSGSNEDACMREGGRVNRDLDKLA